MNTPPTLTPSSIPSNTSIIIISAYMENSRGDSGQPCLTPLPIIPGSDSPSATLTIASCVMYNWYINLLSLQSTPTLSNTSIILIQSTISNAFSKSTKQIYISFPNSSLLSPSTLHTPTTTLIPHLHLNPN